MASSKPTDLEQLRLVLFRVGARLCGISLGAVREIIPPRRTTRLPGASAAVQGIINVRGHVVTVIDLAVLTGGEGSTPAGSLILVEHGHRVVAFAVAEVLDVHRVPLDRLQPAAEAGLRMFGAQAVIEEGERLIVLLDADALIQQVLLLQSEER